MRNRDRVGWLCQQNLRPRQFWNCLRLFSSKERGKRIQINFNQARRKRKQGKKREKSEGKEVRLPSAKRVSK